MTRWAARSTVATLLVVAASLGLPGLPLPAASAAYCPDASGVTVGVEFNDLGGGISGTCVPVSDGDTAADLFAAAGFDLNVDTPGNRGYVCQVDGKPACTRPNGNAYWSLWWSDGRSGSWRYSSLGVGSLKVPDGGYVALAWDDQPGEVQPVFRPYPHTSTPAPSPTRSPSPGPSPTPPPATSDQPSPTPSSSPTLTVPTATASTPSPSATPATPTPTPTPSTTVPSTQAPAPGSDSSSAAAAPELADPAPTSEATQPVDGGVPTWLVLVVVVLLFAIAYVVVQLRGGRPQQ